MKKLVRNSKESIHLELEIIAIPIWFDETTIAAAQHNIKLEPRNMKEAYQLTDAQYSLYVNFIRTAASIIVGAGFDIVDEYQSPDSLSYYIQFTPELYDGIIENDIDNSIPRKVGSDIVLDVKFRLSDHYVTGEPRVADTIGRSKSTGIAFKEFVIAGVTHESINTAIRDIRDICIDLRAGDYSRVIQQHSES